MSIHARPSVSQSVNRYETINSRHRKTQQNVVDAQFLAIVRLLDNIARWVLRLTSSRLYKISFIYAYLGYSIIYTYLFLQPAPILVLVYSKIYWYTVSEKETHDLEYLAQL